MFQFSSSSLWVTTTRPCMRMRLQTEWWRAKDFLVRIFLDASASLGLGIQQFALLKNIAVFQDISERNQCLRILMKNVSLTHLCPTFGLVYCTFDKKFSNWRTNVKYEVPGAHSLHSLLQQSWSVPRETEGSPTDQSLQRLHGLTELWGGSVSKKFNLQIKFILQYCNYNIVFSCCLKFFFNSFGRKSILWALVIENTLPSLSWWN